MRNGVPTIAVVGYGRAGKDTAAEWLRDHTNLRHSGSTSDTMAPLLALVQGLSVVDCHARRHEHRQFWKDWCDRFRNGEAQDLIDILDRCNGVPSDVRDTDTYRALLEDPGLVARYDPAKIVRLHQRRADIIPGIRGDIELFAARDQGLLDLIVWVENPRVPRDFTVDFKREDADIVIHNEADYDTFYTRLRRLMKVVRGVEIRD